MGRTSAKATQDQVRPAGESSGELWWKAMNCAAHLGWRQGYEGGKKHGSMLAKRQALLSLMLTKFGSVPVSAWNRVMDEESPVRLEQWMRQFVTANTVRGVLRKR